MVQRVVSSAKFQELAAIAQRALHASSMSAVVYMHFEKVKHVLPYAMPAEKNADSVNIITHGKLQLHDSESAMKGNSGA